MKKGGGIHLIDDLEGKTIYSPFPSDPAAYLGRSCLNGIKADIVDVDGVSSVILGVLTNKADAGFIADIDLLFIIESMKNKLNVLATSEESVATYILISPKHKSDPKTIKDTLLKLSINPMMNEIKEIHGFNELLPINDQMLNDLKSNTNAVEKIYEFLGIRDIRSDI